MSTIPPARPDQIEFCASHVPVWDEHEAAIGLPDGFTEELDALTQAARAAASAAHVARQASEAATQDYYNACSAMRAKAAKGVRLIRTHADITDDADVLTLAQIDPEKSASAVLPPTTPTNLSCTVEPTGAIRVSWESTGTHGAYFQIFRRLASIHGGDLSPMVCVGGSGTKTFIDATVPLGTTQATYQIHACRGRKNGPLSLATSIQFGSVASGAETTSPVAARARHARAA